MRSNLCLLVLLFFFLSPFLRGEEKGVPPRSITMEEAEEMALRHSYELRSATLHREIAVGQRLQALGEVLPTLGSSLSTSMVRKPDAFRQGADNPSGRYPGIAGKQTLHEADNRSTLQRYDAGVVLTQPIFKGGRILASFRKAGLYEQFAEETIRFSRQDILYEVRIAYVNLLLQEKIVSIHQTQVELAREHLEKTLHRFQAETIPEIEVLRAKVELKNQEALWIQSRNLLETARARFLNIIGLPLDTPFQLADHLSYRRMTVLDEKALAQLAEQDRPELRRAKLQEEMQQQDVKKIRSGLFPSVSLAGRYGADIHDFDWYDGAWKKDWSVGLRMDWTLFEGLLLRGQLRQAEAMLEQSKLATRALLDAIRLDVRTALLNMQSAEEFVLSQRENVAQALRYLQQERIRWDHGAGTSYLDVLNARSSFAIAQKNYYMALHNLEVARIDLRRAIGSLGEKAGALQPVEGEKEEDALPESLTRGEKRIDEIFATLPKPEMPDSSPEKMQKENHSESVSESSDLSSMVGPQEPLEEDRACQESDPASPSSPPQGTETPYSEKPEEKMESPGSLRKTESSDRPRGEVWILPEEETSSFAPINQRGPRR